MLALRYLSQPALGILSTLALSHGLEVCASGYDNVDNKLPMA